MKRFLYIPIFILLTANYAFATDFTLDEAIEEALKNNPDILIAKDKLKQAELKVKGVKGRLNPNLSINAGYSPITDRYGAGFQISQDLDRLLSGNRIEKDNAQLELDVAKQELILTEQRIIKEVSDAYHRFQFAKDDLKLKEKIFDSRNQSLEFANAKFDLGKISMDELLSKQKEVDEARFELNKARYELKKAKLNLSQLIVRDLMNKSEAK